MDIYRVVPLLPAGTVQYHWSPEERSIHEKAKKVLLTHSVTYGSYGGIWTERTPSYGDEAIMVTARTTRDVVWLDPHHSPAHTIVFQYRSRGTVSLLLNVLTVAILEAMEIVPRPQKPVSRGEVEGLRVKAERNVTPIILDLTIPEPKKCRTVIDLT